MITERGGWGVYFSLLLFCGLSLIFSMPWATYVKELLASPWQPSPIVFFATYTLLATIVGLNRGAALAPVGRPSRRLLVKAILQILFAQFLVFPYLAYIRVLLPEREGAIPLVIAYVAALSVAFGVCGYALEMRQAGRRVDSFTARYGLATALFALPLFARLGGESFVGLIYLSPFAAVHALLGGAPRSIILIAFSLPVGLGAFGSALIRGGGEHN